MRFMPDLNECAWDHIIAIIALPRCGEPLATAKALSVCKSFSNAVLPSRASRAVLKAAQKKFCEVHPDWPLATSHNVAAITETPPLASKGNEHGKVYSPYRTV